MCRRCADLEERERELLRNQGSLQEALAQVGARAQAAEEKLEQRIDELQSEHKEVITVLTTNAAATLEVCHHVPAKSSVFEQPAAALCLLGIPSQSTVGCCYIVLLLICIEPLSKGTVCSAM